MSSRTVVLAFSSISSTSPGPLAKRRNIDGTFITPNALKEFKCDRPHLDQRFVFSPYLPKGSFNFDEILERVDWRQPVSSSRRVAAQTDFLLTVSAFFKMAGQVKGRLKTYRNPGLHQKLSKSDNPFEKYG